LRSGASNLIGSAPPEHPGDRDPPLIVMEFDPHILVRRRPRALLHRRTARTVSHRRTRPWMYRRRRWGARPQALLRQRRRGSGTPAWHPSGGGSLGCTPARPRVEAGGPPVHCVLPLRSATPRPAASRPRLTIRTARVRADHVQRRDRLTEPGGQVPDRRTVCEIARRMFAEALARRDLQSRMDEFCAAKLANLSPEAA
jgi:hypothetical protein